ncbi:MAG: PBECR2 nuclease fold domain-containing protein [Alphaproteobacteria bacterium]|nr:PBECR2 nuclease fold domain-containing protein [Alphaproteobacteria bacterium]
MVDLRALPPEEALDFFRKKGFKTTFDHREMMGEAHAYSFTVAKAMRRDVLQDIRAAMDDAIAKGQTLDAFRKNLKPTLQEKGWWGTKTMVDPQTGKEKEVQLGSSRRLRTIFETNMRASYAAGRWDAVQRTKKTFPYLRYVTVGDGHVRAEHKNWHNVVKPVDDPFWEKHYPPNDWGCRCWAQQVSEEDIKKLGLSITDYDPVGLPRTYFNTRTGETKSVPQGIAPGFDYNVGRARMRAMTPPPLDEPLGVPYQGPAAKVPMPPPRTLRDDIELPDGLSDAEYASRFLEEFDAGIGSPKLFQDVTGEQLVISDDLFKDSQGGWKVQKNNRHKYLLLLAQALKQPDEVWEYWEELKDGSKRLRRRYLTRVRLGDQAKDALIAFETGKDGWHGVTTFQSQDKSYLEKQRRGAMVYRKPDKK